MITTKPPEICEFTCELCEAFKAARPVNDEDRELGHLRAVASIFACLGPDQRQRIAIYLYARYADGLRMDPV
jgi:hypothetical protein